MKGKFGTLSKLQKKFQKATYDRIAGEAKTLISGDTLSKSEFISQAEKEADEVTMVDKVSLRHPNIVNLQNSLLEWINSELIDTRIVIKSIYSDLGDGQVLQNLLEVLENLKIKLPELTYTKEGQIQKLTVIIQCFDDVLFPNNVERVIKWTPYGINNNDSIEILHFLIALYYNYNIEAKLTPNLTVTKVIINKVDGKLYSKKEVVLLTQHFRDQVEASRSNFEVLCEQNPNSIPKLKNDITTFFSDQLSYLNLKVNNLLNDFHDGFYLIVVLSICGKFCCPLHRFHPSAMSLSEKLKNVEIAFELMDILGINRDSVTPSGNVAIKHESQKNV
ncbi:Beta-parvin [Intoshia linei]|uniref:Beta-parvin n=1 Tax=Intoshia linei TaxID=1819745 RepID=A0A177B8N4_9BILA|nr:Beta-parvin [Intoshia linei]